VNASEIYCKLCGMSQGGLASVDDAGSGGHRQCNMSSG
jgi:hypothetical protein